MKTYSIFQKMWIKPLLWLVGGLFLGWLLFHQTTTSKSEIKELTAQEVHAIWTCAMHPQIRENKPGLCPICAMELIPLRSSDGEVDPYAVQMTEAGIKLAEVETTVITKGNAQKTIHLYGKIAADERRIKTQSAHYGGRVEELLVGFVGETVIKGQVIARIYSPSLIAAQEELLQAKHLNPAQPTLVQAAREKLLQWKLTNRQIAAVEQSGKVQSVFDVTANVSGVVIAKRVNQGDYVQQGVSLYEVADLSSVWVLFDAYESDLPWIKKGSAVSFSLESLPGQRFSGTVSFVDPVINPSTRVAQVRVEVANKGNQLKPDMFVNGVVSSALPKYNNGIVIPQSAVLWTGERSVVYVKTKGAKMPEFRMREIVLGPALSNSYVVLEGLHEGDEIVTNGTFSVDASAQLDGKPSMMSEK
ncbi:MAG: efflux RND transporter periplasmic adaptor subunit [Bacteroidales bacterium]|nr:efflux RND transporter periplasmic adaptor subunit [Bacteroidales bacterium]